MPEPLSPAAQAVLDTFTGNDTIHGLQLMTPRLAAALRAAADQVVPEQPEGPTGSGFRWGAWAAKNGVRSELLAIAAELEGAQ